MQLSRSAAPVLALVLLGCSTTVEDECPPTASCIDPDVVPFLTDVVPASDWERIERPGFSFSVPPEFEKLDLVPIDSDAAIFESDDGSQLSYDFGPYTSGEFRVTEGITEVDSLATVIGGREVRLWSYRFEGRLIVAAWWGNVRVDGSIGPDHLSMHGITRDPDVRARLLAALWSVAFP